MSCPLTGDTCSEQHIVHGPWHPAMQSASAGGKVRGLHCLDLPSGPLRLQASPESAPGAQHRDVAAAWAHVAEHAPKLPPAQASTGLGLYCLQPSERAASKVRWSSPPHAYTWMQLFIVAV
jgi:hypothetical protein